MKPQLGESWKGYPMTTPLKCPCCGEDFNEEDIAHPVFGKDGTQICHDCWHQDVIDDLFENDPEFANSLHKRSHRRDTVTGQLLPLHQGPSPTRLTRFSPSHH